jgi:CheY-like chemotaxis protein
MTRTPLRLLLVEDSDDDALLVSTALERQGYDIESKRVMTADHSAPRLRTVDLK